MEGVQLHSITPHLASDQGWTTLETVFIRLDTSLTPSGRFPAYVNVSYNKTEVRVGYDAVVCAQKYEPWIVEAYNTSTGSSFLLGVVGKWNGSTSLSLSGNIRGARIANAGYLNATGKGAMFSAAHGNDVTRINGANGDGHFNLTPTVGPVPPCTTFPLTLDLLRRLFPSLMALDPRDILNSLPTGLLRSAHGSVRLTLCRTWRGRDSS